MCVLKIWMSSGCAIKQNCKMVEMIAVDSFCKQHTWRKLKEYHLRWLTILYISIQMSFGGMMIEGAKREDKLDLRSHLR